MTAPIVGCFVSIHIPVERHASGPSWQHVFCLQNSSSWTISWPVRGHDARAHLRKTRNRRALYSCWGEAGIWTGRIIFAAWLREGGIVANFDVYIFDCAANRADLCLSTSCCCSYPNREPSLVIGPFHPTQSAPQSSFASQES